MADKHKTNYIWIGIAVVIMVVLAFVLISNSNKPSNEFICNSPYIKVGTSCCLDQNLNNICDKDETIKQESSNDVWKELYENECYGKDNLISKSQAENIAKHYAIIQTNNNAKNPVSTGDIKTKFPTSTIGEKCNPDWFVSLELDYIDKSDNQETSRYFIIVSGEMVNETLQGASFLPDDYVLKQVEASIDYHGNSDNMQFIGGGASYRGAFTNIP